MSPHQAVLDGLDLLRLDTALVQSSGEHPDRLRVPRSLRRDVPVSYRYF
jgi:hypothetical protein